MTDTIESLAEELWEQVRKYPDVKRRYERDMAVIVDVRKAMLSAAQTGEVG